MSWLVALLTDASSGTAEMLCTGLELDWDCFVALETIRCLAQGWCS